MLSKTRPFDQLDDFPSSGDDTTTLRKPSFSFTEEPITDYNPDLSDDEDLASERDYPDPPSDRSASAPSDLSPPPTYYPDGTLRYFETKEIGLQYCQSWAAEKGYAFKIRNNKLKNGELVIWYLICDKGRKSFAKYYKVSKEYRKRKSTSTRLEDCKFQIGLYKSPQGWSIKHLTIEHNHLASDCPQDHPILRRTARTEQPEVVKLVESEFRLNHSVRDALAAVKLSFADFPIIE
jgi:hypothetical protein